MLTLHTRLGPDHLRAVEGAGLAALDTALHHRWPVLRRPLVLPWTDGPLLALDGDRPWLVAPVGHDPYTRGGRTVVPRAQRRALGGLAAQGVPFQRIAIAHELDPAGPVQALLPALKDGPRTCTASVARQVAGPLPAHPGLVRATRALGALAGAMTSAVSASAQALLDPIVFGVVAQDRPAHGEPALWYPLVAWRW